MYCDLLALMLFESTECRLIDISIGLLIPSVEELGGKNRIFHLLNRH